MVIMAFLLILSVVLIFVNGQQAFRRDVSRLASISQLEKALEVHVSEVSVYPEGKGCVNGRDPVTAALVEMGIFSSDVAIGDPRWPDDPVRCFFYESTGSTYSLNFYLETDRVGKGKIGPNRVTP